jgi:hypothetical protein
VVYREHLASRHKRLYAEIAAGGENKEKHGEVTHYVKQIYFYDIRPFSAQKLEKVFKRIVFNNVALFYSLTVAPVKKRKQIALRFIFLFAQNNFPPGKF